MAERPCQCDGTGHRRFAQRQRGGDGRRRLGLPPDPEGRSPWHLCVFSSTPQDRAPKFRSRCAVFDHGEELAVQGRGLLAPVFPHLAFFELLGSSVCVEEPLGLLKSRPGTWLSPSGLRQQGSRGDAVLPGRRSFLGPPRLPRRPAAGFPRRHRRRDWGNFPGTLE